MGAIAALLIALVCGLILARSQPTLEPSRAELAGALSRDAAEPVQARDLRSIRCTLQSVIYACRWEQREADIWEKRSGRLTTRADGWRLVKE